MLSSHNISYLQNNNCSPFKPLTRELVEQPMLQNINLRRDDHNEVQGQNLNSGIWRDYHPELMTGGAAAALPAKRLGFESFTQA
jgi:hypothetical protein